jgi:hypothetical protein
MKKNTVSDAEVTLACQGLPAMCRGAAAVAVHLELPDDFVSRWMKRGAGEIPVMPHLKLGGTRVFNTAMVMRWLLTWFTSPPESGAGKPVARPVLYRPAVDEIAAVKEAIK